MKRDSVSADDFIDDFIERVRASLYSCTGCVLFSSETHTSSGQSAKPRALGDVPLLCKADASEAGKLEREEARPAEISLGAAVSGGADSVAMFVSLARIARDKKIVLHVITVNHNIRDEAESEGDARYVQKLCADFAAEGFPVDCTCKTLLPGEVFREARKRGRGVEEGARYLRYKAFEQFAEEKKNACIALAHTEDDQLETLLMRFFEGGGADGAGGIKKMRGIFIRPLLDISRREVERFLTLQRIPWRTDGTNGDTSYFRNKIRSRLVPVLDGLMPGWRTALLNGAKKARDDDEALSAQADSFSWSESGDGCRMPISVFSSAPRVIQRRLLYRAFSEIGIERRVPYRFVERICNAAASSDVFSEDASGVFVEIAGESISVKKVQNGATDAGFSAIIRKTGTYEMPFGSLCVAHKDGARSGFPGEWVSVFCSGGSGASSVLCVPLPFCIRSRQAGDAVRSASGCEKNVVDILSAWKVASADRERIPLVQELSTAEQKIVCIWGSVFGRDDWIVNDIEV